MEKEKQESALIRMWALVAMLSLNLVIPRVMCSSRVEDQKTYYHCPDPPAGETSPPSSYGAPPSHCSYGTPPSHGGGGDHGGSPPSNCGGSPPSGGHHTPTPTPTLTPPSGGGYTYTPPISSGGTPTPVTYTPPISGGGTPTPVTYTPPISGGGDTPTPISLTPPTTPIVFPGTPFPGISVPSPPFAFDPNSPPFSCNYWRTHPTLIWGLFGWVGTMGGAFGVTSIPGFGSTMSLQEALSNVRTDGYGALYREGTAALLNSMVDHRFPFTSSQVRDNFVSATRSNKAAAAQARVFRLANEGRVRP